MDNSSLTESHLWHAHSPAQVYQELETDGQEGLTAKEALHRLERYGFNEIPHPPRPSALRQFFSQFASPLVGALLVAALVAGVLAVTSDSVAPLWIRFGDTAAILLIVILNAVLGFVQERRAEAALEALEKMTSPNARVVREGTSTQLPSRELVPGDIVEMEAGNLVPADLRFIETVDAQVQEAALTGESAAVSKRVDEVLGDVLLPERESMAYMGTLFVHGRARAVVVETGATTELGRIGQMLTDVGHTTTPLQDHLESFTRTILLICIVVSALLFFVGLSRGTTGWPLLLLSAVSLAVAAIPEGLPAITTITLAFGMRRMAELGAIIRRLPAVETLGSATIICTDKTGTLTRNEMVVQLVKTAEATYSVTGTGYDGEGALLRNGEPVESFPETLLHILRTAVVCNTAIIEMDKDGHPRVLGDPTEGALIVLAEKASIRRADVVQEGADEEEIPFDSERQRMAVVATDEDGHRRVYVKGAMEAVLPLCTRILTEAGETDLTEELRTRVTRLNAEEAGRGFRMLAFAQRSDPHEPVEEDLVLLGCVGMTDAPRKGVPGAVEECHRAGIRVVMVTGDHEETAVAIAREIGIFGPDSRAMSGRELETIEESALQEQLGHVAVFARVSPEQKLRIVKSLAARGDVVAMTGDGVNDAPSLRQAHIGVAMGKGGTDVAREAADMVLVDDDFKTIVHAVREGRTVFANIRTFISFLLGVNAGLVLAVIGTTFLDGVALLTPLQLLWINLITNGLPALALGIEPTSLSVMERPPRDPTEPVLTRREYEGIAVVGVTMALTALFIFMLPDWWPALFGADPAYQARSMAFTLLALSPLAYAFTCRSQTDSLIKVGILSNLYLVGAVAVSGLLQLIVVLVPTLYPMFKTHQMSMIQWVVVIILALIAVPVAEAFKWWRQRSATSKGCVASSI